MDTSITLACRQLGSSEHQADGALPRSIRAFQQAGKGLLRWYGINASVVFNITLTEIANVVVAHLHADGGGVSISAPFHFLRIVDDVKVIAVIRLDAAIGLAGHYNGRACVQTMCWTTFLACLWFRQSGKVTTVLDW